MAKKFTAKTKDEANVANISVMTIRGLAKDKHFNIGYNDYKSKVWNKDYDTWSINAQWRYERGRHYAAAGGPVVKSQYDARVLRGEALNFINNMLYDRAMI